MKTASGYSINPNAIEAIKEAYETAQSQLIEEVQFVLLYATHQYNPKPILEFLQSVEPRASIFGCTTHKGVMTDKGFHGREGVGLAVLLFSDESGSYGVASQKVGPLDDARSAAAEAADEATANARRPGELPSHVLVHATPGIEESVLLGIEDTFGREIPIVGGTAADQDLNGKWSVFSNHTHFSSGVAVAALYPSTHTHNSFFGGFCPTLKKGFVSAAEGRTLKQIDKRPALEVYNEWTGGLLASEAGSCLHETALRPLGRLHGDIGTTPYFSLIHPIRVLDDKSLELASNVRTGELLFLMEGSKEEIQIRPARSTADILELEGLDSTELAGLIFIFCAGCLPSQITEARNIADYIRLQTDSPFIMPFTFGEQGSFNRGMNSHGNLMVSCLLTTNIEYTGF